MVSIVAFSWLYYSVSSFFIVLCFYLDLDLFSGQVWDWVAGLRRRSICIISSISLAVGEFCYSSVLCLWWDCWVFAFVHLLEFGEIWIYTQRETLVVSISPLYKYKFLPRKFTHTTEILCYCYQQRRRGISLLHNYYQCQTHFNTPHSR